jgi:hypothetical protein
VEKGEDAFQLLQLCIFHVPVDEDKDDEVDEEEEEKDGG